MSLKRSAFESTLTLERLANERDGDERLLDDEPGTEPEHAIAEPPKHPVPASVCAASLLVHGPIDFHD